MPTAKTKPMLNFILAFAAGFLTCALVVIVGYRMAEQDAFSRFWGV